MRKSKIEHQFDCIRQQCAIDSDLEWESELCDNLNCPCARSVLSEWTAAVYTEHFGSSPTWFCTLYMERDIVIWDRIQGTKLKNTKTRFKRLLKSAGLEKALILGVLDATLIVITGLPGNPPPRWHLHWHFFVRKEDLTKTGEKILRKKLNGENAGPTPFLKKEVTTNGFWTAYLWKPSTKMPRRLRTPDGKLCLYRRGYVKGRYAGAMETFMINNPGLTWIFLQGIRRSSGRVIITK